jgi:cytochrome c oxidase subunit 4
MTPPARHAEGPSARGLLVTWVALMLLAALSLALRFAHLGDFGFVAALGIALVKAVLVALVFMELAYERPTVRIAFVAGLVMVAFLMTLVIADVMTRATPPLPPPGTQARDHG